MGTSPAPDTLWREETRRAKQAERDQAQADDGGYDIQLHHPPAYCGVSIGSSVCECENEHPMINENYRYRSIQSRTKVCKAIFHGFDSITADSTTGPTKK